MISSIIEEYIKSNPGQKLTKKEVQGILNAFEVALINKMAAGVQEAGKEEKKVKIFALKIGSFFVTYRDKRKLNLPTSRSGSTFAPEAWSASFKPSKGVKEALKIATEKKSKSKK